MRHPHFRSHCALAILSVLLFACTRQPPTQGRSRSTLEKLRDTSVLHVGYVVYPPTVIKDPNTGKLSGHFVDAMQFIADLLNVRLVYHEADFSTFAAGLQSAQFDLSIAATYRTIPRALAVAFTRPIIYIGNGAIVRKDDKRFAKPGDFNRQGVRLAVAQGEASHEYAREHFPRAHLSVIATSNLALPLAEVLSGRADAGLADAWTTSQFAAQHPEVVDLFKGRPYDLTPVGWAVRPDDVEWLNFVNTALDYLESTGRMRAWEERYNAHWVRPTVEFAVD